MNKIVGVQAVKKDVLSKEFLDKCESVAKKMINNIKEKPTLESMLKAVDDIWNKPIKPQLVFENKDQHYAYVTNLYHDVIEPMSLEEYKEYVLQSVKQRLDGAVGLRDGIKIREAAKLQKDYIAKHTTEKLEESLADLQERNNKVTEAIKKEIETDAKKLKN